MKTFISLIALTAGLFLYGTALHAQSTFPNPPVTSAPPPYASAVASINGTPGITQYLYVVVAHYPTGAVPTPVIVVGNGNASLSAAPVVVSWPALPGALNYDVLRVSANPFTFASCTCAVNNGATTGTSVTDNGAALHAFTAGALASTATATYKLDNTNFDIAQMRVTVNGVVYQGNVTRGTTLPTYCNVGDFFFKTNAVAGANISLCTTANTWTTLSGAGVTQSCGTTSTCAATNTSTTAKVVYGSVPLVSGSPSTATITGISPAFTSTSSYVCVVANATNAADSALKVVNVSASSFTITGPNTVTDTINYHCVGN
jgi:hypothetical protein